MEFCRIQKVVKSLWNKEPSFEDYQKHIEDFKKREIYEETDRQILRKKLRMKVRRGS